MIDYELLAEASRARDKAYPWKTGTKVGCAIRTKGGSMVSGWNIEGLWMTSIHAEVVAVCQLVGENKRGTKIAIVAEAKAFTPCGACLDWLIQFCDEDSQVITQNKYKEVKIYKLSELIPYYPRQ